MDSSLIVETCRNINIPFLAVSVKSEFLSEAEEKNIVAAVNKYCFNHKWIEASLLQNSDVSSNPELRCYHCKKLIFKKIALAAAQYGTDKILEGSHSDDLEDYRPGSAAIKELAITSPLALAGFTKQEIRDLARYYGLDNWNKPSMPCLATRIPYNTPITEKKLKEIEVAENFLFSLGFKTARVRHHGTVARIEVDESDFYKVLSPGTRAEITARLKETGFEYVSLDIEGYRSGSMNREINSNPQ